MLVVLTCFESCKQFGLLTRRIPVAMLPLLNKPLIERHITACAEAGFSEILVAIVENPKLLRRFLGNGERWGVNLTTLDFRQECSYERILDKIGDSSNSDVLIIPAETVINLDLSALTALHEQANHDVTKVVGKAFSHEVPQAPCPQQGSSTPTASLMTGVVLVKKSVQTGRSGVYEHDGEWIRIDSPKKLWAANISALHGRFPWLTVGASGANDGKAIGHHCRMADSATIEGPAFIGDYVNVADGVELKNGCVLGSGVVIAEEAVVDASVVLDNTYIGAQANVVGKILAGKFLMNPHTGIGIEVTDPVIIGDVHERLIRPKLKRLTEFLIAVLFLFISSPRILFECGVRALKRRPLFDEQLYVMAHQQVSIGHTNDARTVKLRRFDDCRPFASKLPGLLDVIEGRMSLVGVRPLTLYQVAEITDDWVMLRFEAPIGLFTILDTQRSQDLDEDEKVVMENYYASTRSFGSDLKLLTKCLVNLVASK
jgi:NDP-sugar pyrophosphorylase family protein